MTQAYVIAWYINKTPVPLSVLDLRLALVYLAPTLVQSSPPHRLLYKVLGLPDTLVLDANPLT